MRALVVAAVLLLAGVAHAADAKCFANPSRWDYARGKETLAAPGERFLADMHACDPAFAAAVEEAVRYQLQDDETRKFVHQRGFVLWAYGVAWSVLALGGLLLYLRQQRLTGEIAELEARLAAEAKR